jgi:hypothetical protein
VGIWVARAGCEARAATGSVGSAGKLKLHASEGRSKQIKASNKRFISISFMIKKSIAAGCILTMMPG